MYKLIIPVGIPGSGKSTYTVRLGNVFIINPDSFRYNEAGIYEAKRPGVWEKSYTALANWLQDVPFGAKYADTAVFDATNLDVVTRSPILHISKAFGVRVEAVYFDTPFGVCWERNHQRSPDRRVPDRVMESMLQRLQKPTEAEGFDKVTVIQQGLI